MDYELKCKMSKENKEMLKLLINGGLVGDSEIKDEKIREFKQKKMRNAYHNTELLLKNYRNLAWLLECFPEYISEELNESFQDIDKLINRLDVEMAYGNKRMESRLESIQKTRLVIDRIHDAVTVLKKYPNGGQRMYEVIYLSYIAEEKLDVADITYRMNISRRLFYRIRSEALTIISLSLWSAPQRDIDFWIDMLVIFDGKKE